MLWSVRVVQGMTWILGRDGGREKALVGGGSEALQHLQQQNHLGGCGSKQRGCAKVRAPKESKLGIGPNQGDRQNQD